MRPTNSPPTCTTCARHRGEWYWPCRAAACRWGPLLRVVAVPVSSSQALGRLQAAADEVVCLLVPPYFQAVGQFYQDFTQVTDEEVMEALHAAERPQA